jgi:hypothetical protein
MDLTLMVFILQNQDFDAQYFATHRSPHADATTGSYVDANMEPCGWRSRPALAMRLPLFFFLFPVFSGQ